MTMRWIFLFILLLGYESAKSQPDIISQNGGFENGTGYPTDHNQLIGRCDHWFSSNTSITPDWYTTQNLSGALQGPCPFEAGDNATVISAQPKITTYNGSLFYAGFGSTEHLRNEFTRSTYAYSSVKISFWYAPRGEERNTHIGIIMVDENNSTNNFEIAGVDVVVDDPQNPPTHQPCTWYYYESPWLPTGATEFERIQIGGTSPPNAAGAFNERGYIYIDDVTVLNGIDCCPYDMLYENTTSLPALTHVENEIRAGYDAGIVNNAGDVRVLNGQNVTFKAGNSIQLLQGFYTDQGSIFSAILEACNPVTAPSGPTVSIQVAPNVFTPNSDGINDVLCFTVNNAQSYDVQVWNRWGFSDQAMIYSSIGTVTSNTICTWNGSGFPDGTYFYIAKFSNCTNNAEVSQFVQVIRGPQRLAAPESSFDILTGVYPNPNDGAFSFNTNASTGKDLELYSPNGQLIKAIRNSTENQIGFDIQREPAGLYLLRVIHQDGKMELFRLVKK